ncbi:MAG: ACP S-malonyltransferase, partial [Kiritimatiellia bacterium]|nr:ACP S-malonyltransferase [Kiritimatiellia bacterium]
EERAGAMLSVIGLEAEKLKAIAVQAGVEIANYNSPEQTVLSGARAGIQAAEKLVKEAGAKRAIMLNVAGAYHSSLMASAAKRLEAFIRDFSIRPPSLPVISNVTGQPHGAPDEIRRQMVRQVTSPVRWIDCVQTLQGQGVTRYIECGPGRVLSGLVKRIHPGAELNNVQDCPSLTKTIGCISC